MWTGLVKVWKSAAAPSSERPGPRERVIDLTAHYAPPPGAVAEAVGADLVLLDLERGSAFRLNSTGRFIYEEVQQGRTPAASARALAERHGMDSACVEHDVTAVLGQLLEAGLLTPAPRTSSASAS